MKLSNIAIVLSRPEEARNVGAVCRAMANSGLSDLRIVGEKGNIDSQKVKMLAIHAFDVFLQAKFFSSLKGSLSDCTFSCATTRRRGKKRKGKLLLPEEAASLVDRVTGNKGEEGGGKAAIVFGNERTGLNDEEVNECNVGVTIPASEEFGSLNLSHAVQIMCYVLFRFAGERQAGYIPIDAAHLQNLVTSISNNLQEIGFFSVAGKRGKEGMEMFWRDILARAALSKGEAQYLEKIFNKIAGLTRRNCLKNNV